MTKSTQDCQPDRKDILFNTVLLGSAESGKTTFIRRLIDKPTSALPQSQYAKTQGVDFATYKAHTKQIDFCDILFDFAANIDITSQECLKKSTGFILFLDTTNPGSFDYLKNIYDWIKSQETYKELPITLIVTKLDHPKKSTAPLNTITRFARENHLPYHLISTFNESEVKRSYRAHIEQSLNKAIPEQTPDNSFTSLICGLSLSAKQALFDSIYNEYKPFFQRHHKPLICLSIISGVTGMSFMALSLANHYLHYKMIATVASTMTLHTVSLLPIGGGILLCAAIILACYAKRAQNDIENTSSEPSRPLGAH